MEIKLTFSDEDATRLFQAHGLKVYTDKVNHTVPIHGSNEQEYTTTQLVVENPSTGENILLSNATQRLLQHKLISDMYFIDKMAVLDALNCIPVKSPIDEIINHSQTSK